MRTQKEILARIEARKEYDFLGFETSIYIPYLTYRNAKQFLKEGVTAKQYKKIQDSNTKKHILKEMKSYMDFAWEKANGFRGISAERSINHYEAWIWLLNDGFLEKLNGVEYEHYGKEKLIAICEQYGWDYKKWDDGVRQNYES